MSPDQKTTNDVKNLLHYSLPDLARVAQRFPWTLLCALILTAYLLLDLHKSLPWPEDIRLVRVPAALTAALYWSFAATLYGEAKRSEPNVKHALVVAGWLVIGLLTVLANAIDLNFLYVIAALALSLSIAGYVATMPGNSALWLFNHTLWFGAAASGVACILFAGGLTVILETIKYLFGLPIPGALVEKIWITASFLIAPAYWLSHVPQSFDTEVGEGEPAELVSRLIAAIVKFILVPLLLAYAAILHVYALKILFDGELPKGRLGWLVLTFGSVVAVTALSSYPTRLSGGRIVALFWRFWPWLLAVPLVLLFLAVGARISEYGLTQRRYLVVLAGVWLVSLVVTQGFAKHRDLRFIPGVLAGLLAFASFGPWGATGWPIRAQVRDFGARLEANGMLRDGRVIDVASGAQKPSAADKTRLHGIIDQLRNEHRLIALRPFFQGQPNDPFNGRISDNDQSRHDWAIADKIRERLALGRNTPAATRRSWTYHVSKPVAIAVDADGRFQLIGPFNIYAASNDRRGPQTVLTRDTSLTVSLESNLLSVRDTEGRTAAFDVAKLSTATVPVPGQPPLPPTTLPLTIARTTGQLPADLVVTSSNGTFDDADATHVNHLSFWLLLRRE